MSISLYNYFDTSISNPYSLFQSFNFLLNFKNMSIYLQHDFLLSIVFLKFTNVAIVFFPTLYTLELLTPMLLVVDGSSLIVMVI